MAVCANGGTCTNSEGSFTCSCTPQFKGDACDDGELCRLLAAKIAQ